VTRHPLAEANQAVAKMASGVVIKAMVEPGAM
jgi:hypothetical protein